MNDSIMNLDAALARLGGDRRLLADMIQFYLEDAPGLLEQCAASLEQKNVTGVERAAHSLKGLSANFSAQRAIDAARELETLARSNSLDGAADLLEKLEREVSELSKALEAHPAKAGSDSVATL